MRNLIDFHVHIDFYQNYNQLYNHFIEKEMYALFVTNLPEIFEKAVQTFNQNKYVKIALGYHPQMAGKYKFNSKLFDTLLPLTKYIGEVGLDFSKDYISTKSQQLDAFQHICKKAGKENKILSIHSRMAEKDVLNILLENDVQNAVFHWYTGNLETLEKIVQHGYYFSVNYSMLRSKRGLEIVRSIPQNKLLIETDGPFSYKSEQYDLIQTYNEFGKSLEITNIRELVFNNLKQLLLDQKENKKR